MITVRSTKKLDEVARDLGKVASEHGFGVMGTHDLREKMVSKGVDFRRGCQVFEVCNAMQAKKVLDVDMAIATALPCRIAAYETEGGVELSTMEPSAMIGMFGHPELNEIAGDVETTLRAIMNETARSVSESHVSPT